MAAVIELCDVTVTYGGTPALQGVNLDIEPGTVTALIGPNGSGKSTLLSLVSGLLWPSSGTALVNGRAPRAARGGVAYVLQQTESNRLLPVTVREVVTMARYGERRLLSRLRPQDRRPWTTRWPGWTWPRSQTGT
ncbi:hypothetical protein BH23ACT9_BH23ACT9_00480 [soil metagenome]